MKRILIICLAGLSLALVALSKGAPAPEVKPEDKKEELFKTSLHHTGRGMAFWYDKANQGLEILSDIPYAKLACKKCHAQSCEACHKVSPKEKSPEKRLGPTSPDLCFKCHDQLAEVLKQNQGTAFEDVHFALGMQCLDCHSLGEMHGNGKSYSSLRQEGALETRCENCHETPSQSTSHRKHQGKVDCLACHTGQMTNLTSTQFEPLAKDGKRVAKVVSDWIFLMNYNQRMTAAQLQAFVLPGDKSFLMFRPFHSHTIMKQGRKCEACHGSAVLGQAKEGQVILNRSEKGAVQQIKGIIPVLEKGSYQLMVEKYSNGKWSPVLNPSPPKIQYAGFGRPLTENQVGKLAKYKSESKGKDKKKSKSR